MFTQTRTSHLKFFEMTLFVMVFFLGSFFINTNIVKASEVPTPKAVLVSCAPGSMDVYDMRTGEKCATETKAPVLIGCKDGSGDFYDFNTGKRCANAPVLIACKDGSGDLYNVNTGARCSNTPLATCLPGSLDKYDMNTGKACTNTTANTIKACDTSSTDVYNIYTGKPCAIKSTILGLANPIKQIDNKKLALLAPNGELSGNITGYDGTSSDSEVGSTDKGLSGRQMISKSLSASVGKVGSIMKGPMSIWIILLIIAILLGGSYAIYELLKKNNKKGLKPIATNTKKENPITPLVNTTNVNATNNTIRPENKAQNTPSPTTPNTPNATTTNAVTPPTTPNTPNATTTNTVIPPTTQQQMNISNTATK